MYNCYIDMYAYMYMYILHGHTYQLPHLTPNYVLRFGLGVDLPKPFMAVRRVLASSSASKGECGFTVPCVEGTCMTQHDISRHNMTSQEKVYM